MTDDRQRDRYAGSGRTKTDSRFWLISIIFHAALAILILVSPVGQRMFTKERKMKPEIVRKNEELAEVVEDIRDLAVTRLKAQVDLLEAGQDRMATNFETMNRHYQPFVDKQLATAGVRFQQEAQKTLERQTVIRDLGLAAHEDETQFPELREALDEHEARIVSGMEEVRRSLRLLAPDNQELLDELKKVEDAQLTAFQHFGWASGTQNGIVRDRKRLETIKQELPEQQEALQQVTAKLAEIEVKQKQARQQESEAKQQLQPARKLVRTRGQEVHKAQEAMKKAGDDAAKQAALNKAKQELAAAQEAETALNQTIKESGRLAKQMRNEERQLSRERGKQENKVKRMQRDQKKITDKMPKAIESRDTNIRISSHVQRKVVDSHKAFIEKLQAHIKEQAAAHAAEGARQ